MTTVSPKRIKDSIRWKAINLYARIYLDYQQTRIGCWQRLLKLENEELVDAGLLLKIEKRDKETGKVSMKLKVADHSTPEKVKEVLEHLFEVEAYRFLKARSKEWYREEKRMLKEAEDLFVHTKLWDWCERTKGLGPVAAMTYSGYINPYYQKEDPVTKIKQMFSVGQMWAYCGLIPGAKMRSGEQSHYNPELKGRMWVIAKNTIMHKDPYYSAIYYLKKEYYTNRPDLLALKERKPKGWKANVDAKAVRYLIKLLISHAFETIMTEIHGREDERNIVKYSVASHHRNSLPVKPQSEMEQQEILKRYALTSAKLLEKLKQKWIEDTSENKDDYFAYLRFADIENL